MASLLALVVTLVNSVLAVLGIFSAQPKMLPKAEVKTQANASGSAQSKNSTSSATALTPVMPPPPPPPSLPPVSHPIQVNPTGINMNDLRYPNSTIVSQGGGNLSLQSSDDTDAITNWYKQKITDLGANTKSFVTTKTNDNVLNNLVGSTGKATIQVKIQKPSGQGTVVIDVTVTSS